ncbi:MAG: ribonuclease P protein component 1 [Promethearchaeota archaeon]
MLNASKKLVKKFRLKEFIGLNVVIIDSTNRNYIGLKGKIIDESYNMITVLIGNEEKKIPKKPCIFKFKPNKKEEINIAGADIIGRPEDRIKKFLKKNRK